MVFSEVAHYTTVMYVFLLNFEKTLKIQMKCFGFANGTVFDILRAFEHQHDIPQVLVKLKKSKLHVSKTVKRHIVEPCTTLKIKRTIVRTSSRYSF